MGLYIAYTNNLKERKARHVFYFENHGCFSLSHKRVKQLFDINNIDICAYKDLIEYNDINNIDAYEILLDNNLSKEDINAL